MFTGCVTIEHVLSLASIEVSTLVREVDEVNPLARELVGQWSFEM